MLTEIKTDQFNDIEFLRGLMNSSDTFKSSLFGKNEDSEDVKVDIGKDNICVTTYQSNHWTMKKVYWYDGTVEELYDGKW